MKDLSLEGVVLKTGLRDVLNNYYFREMSRHQNHQNLMIQKDEFHCKKALILMDLATV